MLEIKIETILVISRINIILNISFLFEMGSFLLNLDLDTNHLNI